MNLCGCAVLNKIICLQVFTSEEMKNNVVSFRNTSRFCSFNVKLSSRDVNV